MRKALFSLLGVLAIPVDLDAYVGGIDIVPPRPTTEDAITVEITGDLPDPCWSITSGDLDITGREIQISINMFRGPEACIQVLQPYDFQAGLGRLPAGAYELTVRDAQDAKTVSFEVTGGAGLTPVRFHRGDASSDDKVDISDPILILNVLFLGTGEIGCDDAADVNDDGKLDMTDAVFTLSYLFIFGAESRIPDPGPRACGVDPTEDALGCDAFAPCDPASVDVYHVESSGISCLTWPCPVWNVRGEGVDTQVSDLDISPLGLSSEEAATLMEELARGEWLVRGYFIPGPEGPAGLGTTLVVLSLAGPAPVPD